MMRSDPFLRITTALAAALGTAACATEELPAEGLWPIGEPVAGGGLLAVTSWVAPRDGDGLHLRVDGRTVVHPVTGGWEYAALAGDGGALGLLVSAGEHTVELVEPSGEVRIAAGARVLDGSQLPTSVYMWDVPGGVDSWWFEPVDPDPDPDTVEVELGSALDHDALIERCLENGEDDLCITLALLPAGGRWRGTLPDGRDVIGSGASYLVLRRSGRPAVLVGSLAPPAPCGERAGFLVLPTSLLAAPAPGDGAAVVPVCR